MIALTMMVLSLGSAQAQSSWIETAALYSASEGDYCPNRDSSARLEGLRNTADKLAVIERILLRKLSGERDNVDEPASPWLMADVPKRRSEVRSRPLLCEKAHRRTMTFRDLRLDVQQDQPLPGLPPPMDCRQVRREFKATDQDYQKLVELSGQAARLYNRWREQCPIGKTAKNHCQQMLRTLQNLNFQIQTHAERLEGFELDKMAAPDRIRTYTYWGGTENLAAPATVRSVSIVFAHIPDLGVFQKLAPSANNTGHLSLVTHINGLPGETWAEIAISPRRVVKIHRKLNPITACLIDLRFTLGLELLESYGPAHRMHELVVTNEGT